MWNDTPVDFIAADFCAGLDRNAWVFRDILSFSPAIRQGTVVSVNILRGRDPYTSIIGNACVSAYRVLDSRVKATCDISWHKDLNYFSALALNAGPKHRGLQFFMTLVTISTAGPKGDNPQNHSTNKQRQMVAMLWEACEPYFDSYQSPESGQYFDSVGMYWPYPTSCLTREERMRLMENMAKTTPAVGATKMLTQKLAALKAVRTAKRRESLTPAAD